VRQKILTKVHCNQKISGEIRERKIEEKERKGETEARERGREKQREERKE
jgi:hypothetical protein